MIPSFIFASYLLQLYIHIYSYLFISIQVQGISVVTSFEWGHPTLRGGTRRGGAEHLLLGGLGGHQPLSCGQSYSGEAAGSTYGPRDVVFLMMLMKNGQIRWSDAPFFLNAKDYPKDLTRAVILFQDLRLECLERSQWGLVALQSKRWDLWKGAHRLINQTGVEIWPFNSFEAFDILIYYV